MRTNVVGVTFSNEDGSIRARIIESMSETDQICVERDPYNQYDSNAVKVCVIKNGQKKQIGFLAKEIAADISPKMRRGTNYKATVVGCGSWNGRPYCEIDIQEIASKQTTTATGGRSFARPSQPSPSTNPSHSSSVSSQSTQTRPSSPITQPRVQPTSVNYSTYRTTVSPNTASRPVNRPTYTPSSSNNNKSSNSGCMGMIAITIAIASAVIYFV